MRKEESIVLSIVLSVILGMMRNESNVRKGVIVPVIVLLMVKYMRGDWDEGYKWTVKDVEYVVVIGGISYVVTKVVEWKNPT